MKNNNWERLEILFIVIDYFQNILDLNNEDIRCKFIKSCENKSIKINNNGILVTNSYGYFKLDINERISKDVTLLFGEGEYTNDYNKDNVILKIVYTNKDDKSVYYVDKLISLYDGILQFYNSEIKKINKNKILKILNQ